MGVAMNYCQATLLRDKLNGEGYECVVVPKDGTYQVIVTPTLSDNPPALEEFMEDVVEKIGNDLECMANAW